ncbi:ribosomal protein L5 [Caldisphaera lagunensis DSM 15908]|uniref:Large ribosomal subunit protein uL5 n=1 Tax=Caldisphaera lagunensis (strain DSM 15908 / JCM 11604 / ANMR 0165 / IC-154) TaxID=1056495 RepID=L0ACE8_CALLD|nr:50S ribosomal protein L5 [Caldisphaera lagunensis]AFZ71089.1 ribosomal protein L5 [Caldisphaera lagunensis DSM 15908]
MSIALSEDEVNKILKSWEENPMTKPRITKVTVNIALGQGGEKLVKVQELLTQLTGQKASLRAAKKTVRAFGVRKGENIATMVTLRREKAYAFLKKALEAVGYRIKKSSIDKFGNVGFGITEYILLPGARYDPEIGIVGMDVIITVEKPGYRIEKRKIKTSDLPLRHRVKPEETMVLLSKEFGVTFI